MGVRPRVGTSRPGPQTGQAAGLLLWSGVLLTLASEAGTSPSWTPNSLVDMDDREASPPPLPSVCGECQGPPLQLLYFIYFSKILF